MAAISLVGADETSFQKRHEHVAVVTDLERGRVLYVADDRKFEFFDGLWVGLATEHLCAIEAVDMDMCATCV